MICQNTKVCVGIVCYIPELILLNEIIDFFKEQDVTVFLYFNSKLPELDTLSNSVDTILGTGQNDGIAKAHKELVHHATKCGFEFIVISDQDTRYPFNYVSDMLNFFQQYHDIVIGCPGWINNHKNGNSAESQYCLYGNKMKLRTPKHGQLLSHGISSGMFVSLNKADIASFIDEELFIDWVDNDFCWQLVSKGYSIRYNESVILEHSLGDSIKSSKLVSFTSRGPLRDYYIVRNAMYIIFHKNYQLSCKPYLIIKVITHLCFSTVFSNSFKQFLNRCQLLCKALYHSLTKQMGRLS
jgi:rhamnosyltransferase